MICRPNKLREGYKVKLLIPLDDLRVLSDHDDSTSLATASISVSVEASSSLRSRSDTVRAGSLTDDEPSQSSTSQEANPQAADPATATTPAKSSSRRRSLS